MAVTISLYNHTRKLFANAEVDAAKLKVMLTATGHTFTAATQVMTTIETHEISGNGWTSGGELIASGTVAVTGTSLAVLDGTDISVTATGGDIGPAEGCVIYYSTGTTRPLFYVDFDGTKTANAGTAMLITWATGGIARWTAT